MDGLFKDMHGYPLSKTGSILTPITEQSKRKFFSVGESQLCHAQSATRLADTPHTRPLRSTL